MSADLDTVLAEPRGETGWLAAGESAHRRACRRSCDAEPLARHVLRYRAAQQAAARRQAPA